MIASLSPNLDKERPPLPGFRLHKLEVYNWGTFDGKVFSVSPHGQTTLLVGENGSGKSTLVDALLTLLVRPQTRNYNVAAGAGRNERDERTYLRGAYDRTVGESGKPQIKYLRGGSGHYSVLLAVFHHERSNASFTIAQVLYLSSDNSVEKVYAYCEEERGIVEDFSDLGLGSSIARTLKERGFRTTASYKEYFQWIQRRTGFKTKAMDILNQTVAVKDVQRLDDFIRQHMLDRKPSNERFGQLLSHFNELSEAHRMLVRVREQEELLRPVVEAGSRFDVRSEELRFAKLRSEALEPFFAEETIRLLSPICQKWKEEISSLSQQIHTLNQLQSNLRNEIARLAIEVEHAGGERLRQLPSAIELAESTARFKSQVRERLQDQFAMAGVAVQITSPDQFLRARNEAALRRVQLLDERNTLRASYDSIQTEIVALHRQISDERQALAALESRRGNLPDELVHVRDSICHALKLAPSDLPFAAELIAVKKDELEWESVIEQVLYSFSRSLLVPDEYYSRVTQYVEGNRLRDSRGEGQRLVYLRVVRTEIDGKTAVRGVAKKESLVDKIEFPNHLLSHWVYKELLQRFDYLACDTTEEFQRADSAAMTRNRHIKTSQQRHEKDDRRSNEDRRHFVLGWENLQKRIALNGSIREGQAALDQKIIRASQIDIEFNRLAAALDAVEQSLQVKEFDTVDSFRHDFEANRLRLEKQKLEQSDDSISVHQSQIASKRFEVDGYQQDRDEAIERKTIKARELLDGQRVLEAATRTLALCRESPSFDAWRGQFESIRNALPEQLSLDNLGSLPGVSMKQARAELEKLSERLVPQARELTNLMGRFLKRFPDEQSDLDPNVESLSSFRALFDRISNDDLPKHEERFKRRLNENVVNEVGLLYGSLEDERQEIRDRIEQLNSALKFLAWKPGTYMRLEARDVADREIQDFRREIAGCLSGTMDGCAESNEASFVRIEKLMNKLRDEGSSRWREKVVDVRNWFHFGAHEIVKETGEARSYYDGGAGQSGGEKGKLAFLVLAAAIAYQYDIDPESCLSDRFAFVMVDEMFSRSDDQHAEYALDLFARFGLQLLIVAPLDSKIRVCEPYVGTYLHVVKNNQTHKSELIAINAEVLRELEVTA